MIRRPFMFVALAVALALSVPAAAAPFLVTQDFTNNTDLPGSGWESLNNRTGGQNYGWTNTNNTGNTVLPPLGAATGTGELGGTITRDSSPANFYGYNVGSITLDEDFEASGVIRYSVGTGGFNLGYFRGASSYGSAGNAVNFVGFFFDDSRNSYATIYNAAGGRDRSDSPYDLIANRVHAFRMQYKTNGFNPDTLVLTLDGNVHTHAVGITAPNLLGLTHFGILPASADGNPALVYLDDLTFTVNPIPEPSAAVGVLAVTMLTLLRRSSRRRPTSARRAAAAAVA
jgi:hypothetical protein